MNALTKEDWTLRRSAVYALSEFGTEAATALPALKKLAANDENESVRSAADLAVRRLGDQ